MQITKGQIEILKQTISDNGSYLGDAYDPKLTQLLLKGFLTMGLKKENKTEFLITNEGKQFLNSI